MGIGDHSQQLWWSGFGLIRALFAFHRWEHTFSETRTANNRFWYTLTHIITVKFAPKIAFLHICRAPQRRQVWQDIFYLIVVNLGLIAVADRWPLGEACVEDPCLRVVAPRVDSRMLLEIRRTEVERRRQSVDVIASRPPEVARKVAPWHAVVKSLEILSTSHVAWQEGLHAVVPLHQDKLFYEHAPTDYSESLLQGRVRMSDTFTMEVIHQRLRESIAVAL